MISRPRLSYICQTVHLTFSVLLLSGLTLIGVKSLSAVTASPQIVKAIALVDRQPITAVDFNYRAQLAFFLSNLSKVSQKERDAVAGSLYNQLIRAMIEEKIKLSIYVFLKYSRNKNLIQLNFINYYKNS